MNEPDPRAVTRRDILQGAGVVGLSALAHGCQQLDFLGGSAIGGNNSTGSASTGTVGNPDCVLTPQQTEGPYYLDAALLRSDITEGKTGVGLHITIRVVEAGACTAIPNAIVDIWHADAVGVYSGYQSEGTAGQTFLRGSQVTDANGEAAFHTVYPGWYTGRAVHIHAKVHLDATTELTTQFYFEDALTNTVYANNAPYNTRANRDTLNSEDGIYPDDAGVVLSLVADGTGGYTAAITIGVAA